MERVDELEATLATDRVALKAKKDEQAVYLKKIRALSRSVRNSPTNELLFERNEERLNQAQNHRRLADELMRTIADKEADVQLMGKELIEANLSLEDLPRVSRMSVNSSENYEVFSERWRTLATST